MISSIHILIPQIETVLRTLLFHKKVQIPLKFFGNDEKINESQLHVLLKLPNVKEFLGENFAKYMEIKFVDQSIYQATLNDNTKTEDGMVGLIS
jgi:hypothetical protein